MNVNLAQIEDEYARLRARLGRLGWISHGYVQDRGPGAGGPCYQWTRKVKAKTVSVALSREQYEALKEAIDNLASGAGNPPTHASPQPACHL